MAAVGRLPNTLCSVVQNRGVLRRPDDRLRSDCPRPAPARRTYIRLLSGTPIVQADAAAAAGPKGRDAAAATDVTMRAEILTYSRSRGLFAGVSLEGSTLRPDNEANRKPYGRELPAKDIVLHGRVRTPASAKQLVATLNNPRRISRSKVPLRGQY